MKNNIKMKIYNNCITQLFEINVIISLIIFFIYFSYTILIPFIGGFIDIKNNNLFLQKYNHAANIFSFNKKKNYFFTNLINKVTYIDNQKIIFRQIDNNNLQSYISDAKRSVLKINDNNDTENNKTYSYDAYGNVIAGLPKYSFVSFPRRWKPIPNPFQYNGERFDQNSKLQYLRARFYNSQIKRFITEDNYDLLNKFGFVNANPIMNTDSQGHDALNWLEETWKSFLNCKVAWITVAAVAGAICLSIGAKCLFNFYNKQRQINADLALARGLNDAQRNNAQPNQQQSDPELEAAIANSLLNFNRPHPDHEMQEFIGKKDFSEVLNNKDIDVTQAKPECSICMENFDENSQQAFYYTSHPDVFICGKCLIESIFTWITHEVIAENQISYFPCSFCRKPIDLNFLFDTHPTLKQEIMQFKDSTSNLTLDNEILRILSVKYENEYQIFLQSPEITSFFKTRLDNVLAQISWHISQ